MNTFLSLKYKFQNFSTYFITWFFPKGRGKLFWKVYVYMRWVDDIIDNMSISQDYKRKFLKEQKILLKAIYAKKKIRGLRYEEQCIYDIIIKYRKDKKSRELKKHIFNMMWTFEYDTNRVGKNIKEREFMRYSKLIGEAYAFVFTLIFDISKYMKKYDKIVKKNNNKFLYQLISDYAHYAHLIHIIRDYNKDKDMGYINYPENTTQKKYFEKLILFIRPKLDYLETNFFKDLYNENFLIRFIVLRYYFRFKHVLEKLKNEPIQIIL